MELCLHTLSYQDVDGCVPRLMAEKPSSREASRSQSQQKPTTYKIMSLLVLTKSFSKAQI